MYTSVVTMENPEINLHFYGELIFNKGANVIQCEKNLFFFIPNVGDPYVN